MKGMKHSAYMKYSGDGTVASQFDEYPPERVIRGARGRFREDLLPKRKLHEVEGLGDGRIGDLVHGVEGWVWMGKD